MVADVYAKGNDEVKVKDGMVVAEIEGYMEPVSASLAAVLPLLPRTRFCNC